MQGLGELRRYFLPAWLAALAVAAAHLFVELFASDWSRTAWFGAALSVGAALGHLAHARFSGQPRIAPTSRQLLLAGASAGAFISLWQPSFAPFFYALALGLGGTLAYLYAYLPLSADDAGAPALKVGAAAPAFALAEQRGWPIDADSLSGHPTALVFIQGNWSPLCRAQLAELADCCALHPPAAKSRVLVISAQPARKTEQLALELPTSFWCCVDAGAKAAAAFGVARPGGVPWGLWGHGVDSVNPAVVVLDADGRIAYADVAAHGHWRPPPRDYIALLGREPLSLTRTEPAVRAGERDAGAPVAEEVAEPAAEAAAEEVAEPAAAPGPRTPVDLSAAPRAPAVLRPAATVVPVRDGDAGLETLMLLRGEDVGFLAGAWVFPGGRVDAADCKLTESDSSEAVARRAGARETAEESGLRVSTEAMAAFAHWTAPPESPKRYATWFFLAVPEDPAQPVAVDGTEIVEHRWLRPADALAAQARGDMKMLPPTFITLSQLGAWGDTAAALRAVRRRPVEYFAPKIASRDGAFCNLYREDAGHERADPDAPGPRHRFWMSPDGWRYERDFDRPATGAAHAQAN